MRILEINKFYNSKRGADKHFLDVIELLKEGGHQVAAFSMLQKDNEQSEWSKYFLSTVGYNKNFTLWQQIKGVGRMFYSFEAKRKINQLLDGFQPELVHIHNVYHQMSPAILFEIKKRNIPIVMTVHDFKLINPNHSMVLDGKPYLRCKNGRYYQCFLDKAVKSSYLKSFIAMLEMYWHELLGTYRKNIDLYLVPSLFVKQTLIEWGIPAEKIQVLPHFISNEPKSSNMEIEKGSLLYAGKISELKGADKLIQAVGNKTGLRLYLAGEIEEDIELPKGENVQYLGVLKQEVLQKYLDKADFVVSGSRLPETFGLVALEAISHGKPFIGYNVGAYGELIESGKNGFLAENDQQFDDLLLKLANGALEFDRESISSEALKKYSKKAYLSQFEALMS
jgi:glycosyltransferase involved in cell wall biosynthesis